GKQPFVLGDLGVGVIEPACDGDQQGDLGQPAAVVRFFLGSQRQAGRLDGAYRHVGQSPYGVAAYQREAPGPQLPMIGRRHGRLQNAPELVFRGAGSLHEFGGTAGKQIIDWCYSRHLHPFLSSAFMSRTAFSHPSKTARATMACPILSSAMPGMATMDWTFS